MAYLGGGDRGDQGPPYGGAGDGGGRHTGFVWPPPATTPRPVPPKYQVPMGYRAPMVLPHQVTYGAPAAVYGASEPASTPSAPSAAALAKEVKKNLFVSKTALAPPAAAASDTEDVDLAPVSKKGLAHPARPGLGTVGKKVGIWFVLFVMLSGIGYAHGSCDTNALSDAIGLYCTSRSATAMCCDVLTAAVDVGGVSCLCQTAADPVVQHSFLNKTDLLRLYRECGGRHVPLEIYCDQIAPAPNPAPALPPVPPPPPPPRQAPPPHRASPPPPPTDSGEGLFRKFLSTWWGRLLFVFSVVLAGLAMFLPGLFCLLKHGYGTAIAGFCVEKVCCCCVTARG